MQNKQNTTNIFLNLMVQLKSLQSNQQQETKYKSVNSS